uniref:Uncharacterized protein n=1 Tax=Aegilops tauschii subsp. strangulata TaxID=200361 RepID=A0A452XPK7_AEGTS
AAGRTPSRWLAAGPLSLPLGRGWRGVTGPSGGVRGSGWRRACRVAARRRFGRRPVAAVLVHIWATGPAGGSGGPWPAFSGGVAARWWCGRLDGGGRRCLRWLGARRPPAGSAAAGGGWKPVGVSYLKIAALVSVRQRTSAVRSRGNPTADSCVRDEGPRWTSALFLQCQPLCRCPAHCPSPFTTVFLF